MNITPWGIGLKCCSGPEMIKSGQKLKMNEYLPWNFCQNVLFTLIAIIWPKIAENQNFKISLKLPNTWLQNDVSFIFIPFKLTVLC